MTADQWAAVALTIFAAVLTAWGIRREVTTNRRNQ